MMRSPVRESRCGDPGPTRSGSFAHPRPVPAGSGLLNLLLRPDADEVAVAFVGDDPESAVGALLDVAHALVLIEEEAFFTDDLFAVEDEAGDVLAGEGGDEEVVFPFGDEVAGVEAATAGGD